MTKNRLEAFSDGVLAIPCAFFMPLAAQLIYVLVAVIWIIPDLRIERLPEKDE
jgi:hypothetical protein